MNRKYSGKHPPFVAVYRLAMNTEAYRALSVGARATYLELRKNYNNKAQNAVFLSAREGARLLGAHRDTVCKWVHELEWYGFIREVQGAHLGVTGTGKAAHYRLTDCPHAGSAPTYDFQSWDGVLYDPKNQNPVRKNRTPRPKKSDTSGPESDPKAENRPTEPDIRTDDGCPTEADITSLTTPCAWSAPSLTELPWNETCDGRGKHFIITRPDGSSFGGESIASLRWWLDVEKDKPRVEVSTACGIPLYGIN